MLRSFSFAVLLTGISCIPGPSIATSIIKEHLHSVHDIKLVVLMPTYQPIPGLSPQELKGRVESLVSTMLTENGFVLSTNSSVLLVVDVDHLPMSGESAVLVHCELVEPATTSRRWSRDEHEPIGVVTWSQTRLLRVTSGEEAYEDLADAIEMTVDHFAGQVEQARALAEPATDQ